MSESKHIKRIPLTQGQFAIVDTENYEWLSKWKWYAHWAQTTNSFYAVRNSPRENGKSHQISMAREILGLKYGDKRQSDHINHNTLDNRVVNLRVVNDHENRFNYKNPKGYIWRERNQKYQARIGVNGKDVNLGLFDTPEKAHQAYREAKNKYHLIGA